MVSENLEVLLEVPEVLRIGIAADGKRKIEESYKLQVLYHPQQDAVFLCHDTFIYSLNKNLPVFTNTRPTDFCIGKRYVISLGAEQKALVFGSQVDPNLQKQFEELVNEYSKLYFANDGVEPEWIGDTIYANNDLANEIHKSHFFTKDTKIEATAAGGMKEPAKIAATSEVKKSTGDGTASATVGQYLSIGGDLIMQGLTKAGEMLGKGIRTSSATVKSLVGKNENPVVVNPTTVSRVKAANQISSTVTTFSKQQIANVVEMGLKLGKQAKDEFASSEKGKQITNNKYYIHAANVGAGAANLFFGIYNGLENAFTSVAQGTKGMTESVLEHKYGKDVKEVFSHSADAAWNVYSIRGAMGKEVIKQTGQSLQNSSTPQQPVYGTAYPPSKPPGIGDSWNMNKK